MWILRSNCTGNGYLSWTNTQHYVSGNGSYLSTLCLYKYCGLYDFFLNWCHVYNKSICFKFNKTVQFYKASIWNFAGIQKSNCILNIQSTLDISNSDMSNSAKLEASIWIKNTFWLLSPTIIWRRRFFYKSRLPEVQINLHFG